MNRPEPTNEIRALADARQVARDARDFGEADRLKAEIEATGWAVVDQAHSYRLHRAYPVDVVTLDGRTLYGWSGAVPSRLDVAPDAAVSLVLVAPDDPDGLQRLLAGLAGTIADDVQRIVVANAPDAETQTLLVELAFQWAAERVAGDAAGDAEAGGAGEANALNGAARASRAGGGEVVWLAERVGAAAALNAGIRRAAGSVVILIDAGTEPMGDVATPLVEALQDPTIAVAGPWGLASGDLRRFEPVSVTDIGPTDVTAISLAAMAFRRADYAARGPLDEQFVERPLLDAWWSLVLRDPEGEEMTPRRAVLVDVPLIQRAPRDAVADQAVERRNRYRIIDTFGGRRDMAVPRRET